MATRRELLEAHAFGRRRLVTAFVSGAPGGREVEPTRPMRVVAGGATLAVLLVAGAALAGFVTSETPNDWAHPGLFVSRETGAAYVITDAEAPLLHPVVNLTSAKLILGDDTTPTIVEQSVLDEQVLGGDVGILGAPASPPAADRLIESGWTACTSDATGIHLLITERAMVRPTASAASVVRTGGAYYVLARSRRTGSRTPGTFRYLLPRDPGSRDSMLTALGLRVGTDATEISESYLGLFPLGGDLAWGTLGLERIGEPAAYATAGTNLPTGSRIGDIVTYDAGALLLGPDHPIELDPFALAVATNLPGPRRPRTWTASGVVAVERGPSTYAAARWPDRLLRPLLGERCARLDARPGEAPSVHLVRDPSEAASAADLPRGSRSVRVDGGAGAVVRSGNGEGTDSGTPYLVDAQGFAHPLVDPDAAADLGYADVHAPVVPDSWLRLLRPGVALSRDAALCPPANTAARFCG